MRKTNLLLLLATMSLLTACLETPGPYLAQGEKGYRNGAPAASSQAAQHIQNRVDAAYRHIEQGLRSGSITREEGRHLRAQFQAVRDDEARALRDHHLDRREQDRLNEELDRLERHIYRAKHN